MPDRVRQSSHTRYLQIRHALNRSWHLLAPHLGHSSLESVMSTRGGLGAMISSINQTMSCFSFSNSSSRCLSRTLSSSTSALSSATSPFSFWTSACSSSITAAGGDDDSPPETGCPARRPYSMAWAEEAACELAPPAGAVHTLTFCHWYAFACSGHDQFRLRMGEPRIDKRHDNPLIFSLASSAPQAGGQSWKYSYSAHHRQVTYHSPEPGWSSTSLPGSTPIVAGPGGCML